MPSVRLSSGEVHYVEQGHGTPLLLLSANPGEARDFDAIIPALAATAAGAAGRQLGGRQRRRASGDRECRAGARTGLVSPGGFTAHNAVTRMFCGMMGSRCALSPRRWACLYPHRRNDSASSSATDSGD